jgi:hypothetical protein
MRNLIQWVPCLWQVWDYSPADSHDTLQHLWNIKMWEIHAILLKFLFKRLACIDIISSDHDMSNYTSPQVYRTCFEQSIHTSWFFFLSNANSCQCLWQVWDSGPADSHDTLQHLWNTTTWEIHAIILKFLFKRLVCVDINSSDRNMSNYISPQVYRTCFEQSIHTSWFFVLSNANSMMLWTVKSHSFFPIFTNKHDGECFACSVLGSRTKFAI